MTGWTPTEGPAERLAAAMRRDGPRCVWCGATFDGRLCRPTREHLVPRIKGGPSWPENELAACRRCNGERGHVGAAEWLEECERRGWTPDRTAVLAALERLRLAIAERGGQRRARPHLDHQLRRLRK